ncbi:helicase-like transcription factor [Fusarium pseudoanthophilum]|uniref:Helicase-like transcription factor n=1 Tax=Fusarium pseudoanthophilum TaxID=48495 RepID=A0A8H5P7L1_9HYPO|nr:helicase-like transcription factor [Fusarium pseudoanthophilum]
MPRRPAKRAHDLIDLTGDDESETRQKRPVPNGHHNQQQHSPGQGGTSVYGSSSSQAAPSSTAEPDYLDLTQDDDGPPLELYGTFHGKIVGVRYYRGYASAGENVLCRREPNNQYDSNAIRVDNVVGDQIGHLPRKIVEKLAPYVDRGDVVLEAQLTGEKGFYDCPVKLFFYGPSDPEERSRIEESLKKDRLVKATELKNTRKEAEARRKAAMGLVNGSSTHGLGQDLAVPQKPEITMDNVLQKSEAVEMRKGGDAIKSLAIGEDELAKMPMAEQPEQLKAQLLPYQLQGLAWMTSKENPQLPEKGSKEPVQLWLHESNNRFHNIASGFVTSTAPKLLSGGILADDMGLGKTLQIISLILTGGKGPTLIVAPVSVMSNWSQQIRRHVKGDQQPSIFVYHGGEKLHPLQLKRHDVVITSYGRLARERDSSVPRAITSPQIKWRRVVLDEGHTIRNSRTKVALAACEINAESRWVLTGTPIVNSVKDLHSLVRFLHITGGIEESEIFNAQITRKLANGERHGEVLLQALMHDLCLRRRKDMKFVDLKLPAKKEYVHRIPFRKDEKRKYDALLDEARGELEQWQAGSQSGQKGRFQNVLERLLRLRQICNHWTLCRERVSDILKLLDEHEVVPLNAKNRGLLQEALRLYVESQEECAICYDNPNDPVITTCKHVFCRNCILRAIQIQHKCPMCRNKLDEDSLLEPAPEDAGEDTRDFDADSQSSKTEAMLQILKATMNKEGSKVVVFSQWTSFLNIVEAQLKKENIGYTRIDGSMKADKRDKAIEALDSDPKTRVMLASLSVCSVGLNLVAADTVILSDSWWAPAIEDQAIDRVHRLGQTRETTIFRLVMEGSVEERVLDVQGEKRELVTKAFREKGNKKRENSRAADISKLLG